MSQPFIAEIRLFGGNFAPRGWAFCQGQILSISQNTALFALIGTIYGGNGTTNFALPNLQNRIVIGSGNGPGLTPRQLGEFGGVATVTLLASQMPQHMHSAMASTAAGTQTDPTGAVWAASVGGRTPPPLYATTAPNTPMSPAAIGVTGGGQPHNNLQPVLGLNYIIALQGIFPSRN